MCSCVYIKSSVSCEGLDARDVSAQNQIVDVVGAFVSFHRLKIGHVAHDGVLVENTVRPVDISGNPSNFQSDVNVVHLGKRYLFGEPRTVVLLLAQVVGQELPLGDFT